MIKEQLIDGLIDELKIRLENKSEKDRLNICLAFSNSILENLGYKDFTDSQLDILYLSRNKEFMKIMLN